MFNLIIQDCFNPETERQDYFSNCYTR